MMTWKFPCDQIDLGTATNLKFKNLTCKYLIKIPETALGLRT